MHVQNVCCYGVLILNAELKDYAVQYKGHTTQFKGYTIV